MSVVAIRCEACSGHGWVWSAEWSALDDEDAYVPCLLCQTTGIERPPQDDDKRAQQAIQGESND